MERQFNKWALGLLIATLSILLVFVLITTLRRTHAKPVGTPTTLASIDQVGSRLLLEEATGNPTHRPAGHYDYIMPEAQQRRIFSSIEVVRPGMTVEQVVRQLGPPLQDYWSTEQPDTRYLIYYFATNLDRANHRPVENGGRARLVLYFNMQGVLNLIDSNVIEIQFNANEGPPFWRELRGPTTDPAPLAAKAE